VRQLPDGKTVDVKGIFTAVDMSAFAAVQLAVEDEDHSAFVSSYKSALEACYSCHVSSGLPYLRPVVPTSPASTLISFEPLTK
jgi:hypothetical protein